MALIILGRDGVINQNVNGYVTSPELWEPIEGSLEAIARLKQAGYRVIVIMNQPGIANGMLTAETLNRIHSKMRRMVSQSGGKIEAILFSSYDVAMTNQTILTEGDSLAELSHRLRITLEGVPVISNSINDIQAAINHGARPIRLKTDQANFGLNMYENLNIETYVDLSSAVSSLLEAGS